MAAFLLLHAWKCCPESMRPLARELKERYPAAKVLAPAAGLDCEWYSYLTDRQGEGEDLVDTRKLRWSRGELLALLNLHSVDLERLVVIGISQGGCMALDLASHVRVMAVVTVVSHVLYATRPRKLLAPWYALVCERDDVFPRRWAGTDLHKAARAEVHPHDHFVPLEASTRFVLRSSTSAIAEHEKRARRAVAKKRKADVRAGD